MTRRQKRKVIITIWQFCSQYLHWKEYTTAAMNFMYLQWMHPIMAYWKLI